MWRPEPLRMLRAASTVILGVTLKQVWPRMHSHAGHEAVCGPLTMPSHAGHELHALSRGGRGPSPKDASQQAAAILEVER